MAKQKTDAMSEVRKAVGTKKFVIGEERAVKALKSGKAAKVFFTQNCADSAKESIRRYAAEAGVPAEELPVQNDELGTICKKMFSISVVSLLKE